MPLTLTVMTDQLKAIFAAPTNTEAAAIQAWADGYAIYAANAQALTTITPAGVALGKAGMISGMAGLTNPGNAATAIATGLRGFWSAVAGGLATSFAGATAITAPPFVGLEAALTANFATNNAPGVTRDAAAALVALNVHAYALSPPSNVGTVTTPGAPPVITPIA